jgi:hypothetical protein
MMTQILSSMRQDADGIKVRGVPSRERRLEAKPSASRAADLAPRPRFGGRGCVEAEVGLAKDPELPTGDYR